MKPKRKTLKEIANLLRLKKPFTVQSKGERNNVLLAADALNLNVTTRMSGGEFHVFYLP